jgi:dipeptidyl aminopeptidase/acylaminoacyl peptidase
VDDVVLELKRAGIPYQELIFQDEGHGIGKTANQRTLLLRLAAFFAQSLSKGR